MENLEETDNITKNIVQEIVRECKKLKFDANENFCVYYVKLLTLDPYWKISPEKKLNRENIQNIVTFIIKKLQDTQCFDLITLKVQHTFLSHLTGRENMLETHKQLIIKALNPLFEDIIALTTDDLVSKQIEVKLYRKIALYSTLKSGLGNPKHAAVLKESIFALKSVLDENDIPYFLQLKSEEKQTELNYYKNLIAGIRLFHRDCGRPSADIEDLPKILVQALTATITELQNELLAVMEEVNLTTSAIDNIYVFRNSPQFIQKANKTYNLSLHLEPMYPEGLTEQDVKDTLNILILARQKEVYIRRILKDIQEIDDEAKKLFNILQEVLTKLHSVVKYKVAVSTNVVYPLFIELSETWRKIQDEAVLLSIYYSIFVKINALSQKVNFDFNKLNLMIRDGLIQTDAMRLEKTMGLEISQQNTLCQILYPTQIKDFDKMLLQYLGFCVWSLVQTEGGLIPGNPNTGICMWKNKYYVFVHPSAAAEFGKDPDTILMQALTIVRYKPELINLLQLHESISELRDVSVLYEKPSDVVMVASSQIQTEVHPVKGFIDPNYVWNTWDYYRQAIKLANITRCATHSMQTKKSHFRCPAFVQTTEPRDKTCQTKTDNYMNVAKPMNFIYGLRGRKDDLQCIIDLTRPIDEEYFYKCATANEKPPTYKTKPRKCHSAKSGKTKSTSIKSSGSSICRKSVGIISRSEDSFELEECICITNIKIKD